MSATGKARDAGTTLLEAMVVVSITALVAGLIFPSIQRTLDLLALRQGTTVFAANLRAARAQALRSGQPTAVALSPDGQGYAWPGGSTPRVGRDIRLTPAGAQVIFFPDGASTGGQVRLAGGRRQLAVSVDPVTGATRIER